MENSFWPAGKRAAISLSFDDARVSQVDNGLPILDRHGVKATFYLSPPLVPQRLEAWKAALAGGHEMGNHTMTHPCTGNFSWSRQTALEDFTLPRMEKELLDANQFIADTIGRRPVTFAYCCGQKYVGRGANSQSYVPLVARHFLVGRGFRDEVTNDPSFVDLAQASGIDGDITSLEYLMRWIDRAVSEGSWLILAAHDVGVFPRQAMTVEVLEALCAYCGNAANGIWLDTIAAVGGYVQSRRAS